VGPFMAAPCVITGCVMAHASPSSASAGSMSQGLADCSPLHRRMPFTLDKKPWMVKLRVDDVAGEISRALPQW
jgi:hypothetical protein